MRFLLSIFLVFLFVASPANGKGSVGPVVDQIISEFSEVVGLAENSLSLWPELKGLISAAREFYALHEDVIVRRHDGLTDWEQGVVDEYDQLLESLAQFQRKIDRVGLRRLEISATTWGTFLVASERCANHALDASDVEQGIKATARRLRIPPDSALHSFERSQLLARFGPSPTRRECRWIEAAQGTIMKEVVVLSGKN